MYIEDVISEFRRRLRDAYIEQSHFREMQDKLVKDVVKRLEKKDEPSDGAMFRLSNRRKALQECQYMFDEEEYQVLKTEAYISIYKEVVELLMKCDTTGDVGDDDGK